MEILKFFSETGWIYQKIDLTLFFMLIQRKRVADEFYDFKSKFLMFFD